MTDEIEEIRARHEATVRTSDPWEVLNIARAAHNDRAALLSALDALPGLLDRVERLEADMQVIASAPAFPTGWRIVFQEPKRTVDQNSRMWVLLTAISTQLVWHGQRYSPEDWKDHFVHLLNGGRFMPSEDGGMIPIGRSTSKLGKQEHTLLQEIIEGFAERHGVNLREEV